MDVEDNEKNKMKTKITSAKKVLRKNIKVNSKVTFDEDGEVGIILIMNKIQRPRPHPRPFRILLQPITVNTQKESDKQEKESGTVSFENNDGPHDTGGIDLKKSSLKLVKQDKLDKQEFRERIKQKHREKRMKNKVKRKRYEVCHHNALRVILQQNLLLS